MNPKLSLALGAAVLAVTVAACGGSGGAYGGNPMSPTPVPSPTPAPGNTGADLVITIVGDRGAQSFSPNPGSLKTGQKVAFYNADSIVHRIVADGGAFDAGNIGPGGTSAAMAITAAGAYGYHCSIHPDMVGTLNVTDPAAGGGQ